jgi:hypothetical protein
MTFTAALLAIGTSSSCTVHKGEKKYIKRAPDGKINIHLPVKTVDDALRIMEERDGESIDRREDKSPSEAKESAK